MPRLALLALAGIVFLSACDGTNPFMVPDIPDETVDPTDPNVDTDNRFAFDQARGLTMNSVEYDAENDELVINNLPFDGPDGRYDRFIAGNGVTVYASRQTATTGLIQHYAVFLRSDHLQATAAAGRETGNFGNAGANINRDSFSLPGGVGEYVYRGTYGGTRTFDTRQGVEITTGRAQILLDVLDFDPDGTLQGDIIGTIVERTRLNLDGTDGRDLPDIVLAEIRFNNDTGSWEGGGASTGRPISTAPRDTGTYDGLIAGPNGEELGGYIVMQGVADVQLVTYQQVQWRVVNRIPILNPLTGLQLTDVNGDLVFEETVQTGTSSGLENQSIEQLTALINSTGGADLPDYLPATSVPDGAEILSDVNIPVEIQTDYQAREVGVFVADQI